MHFDSSDMRLFVAVAQEKNLTRGAKKVHLSPAAASTRIKAFEDQLGAQLLYRDTKGVALTAAGVTLLHHARLILRQAEHLESEVSSLGGDSVGHVRIFANTTAVTEFMPEILARFMSNRPAVTVDLQERLTRDIIRGVREGTADVGIVAGPVSADNLEITHFSTDRLVLVAAKAHPVSGRDKVRFSDTLSFEHVGLHEGSTLHAFLTEIVQREGKCYPVRIQVRSFEAMCRMIEAGVGIGILPESAARRHSKTMELAILELDEPWAIRERSLLVRHLDGLPGCVRALVDDVVRFKSARS